MKSIRLIYVLIFSLFLSTVATAQKKYDKLVAKTNKYYNAGSYAKAKKFNDKLKKKSAKLGADNKYTPGYWVTDAKLQLVQGLVEHFDTSIGNALKVSSHVFGDASIEHASINADVANVYNLYGYYRLAREYSVQATNIYVALEKEDPALNSKIILEKAEAMIGQGYSKDAIKLLSENNALFARRAVTKDTYVKDGKIENTWVPEAELVTRFESYARALTLGAYAYSRMGSLISADSAFVSAHTWIRQNKRYMGEASLALVTNDYYHTLMLAENNDGIVPPEVDKYLTYRELLSDLKKQTSGAVPLAHEMYLAYLNELQRDASRARYANLKAEYDRMIGKNFSKRSLININLKAVEFDGRLAKNKTRSLESDALAIMNSKALPRVHSTSARTLQFLYDMSIETKRYSNAEAYLGQIVEIRKELCGANSPEYHLAKIGLANYYVDYTNKIDEAKSIYDDSYGKILSNQIGAWHKDHLNILNHLATMYELTDQYALAKSTLEKASAVANAKYKDTDYAYGIELNKVAQLYIKLGLYDQADSEIKHSLDILEKSRKDDEKVGYYIQSIQTEARLFGIKGLFDEAQDRLDQTKKLIKRNDVSIGDELATAEEMSSLFIQLGKYSETDKLLTRLILEYEKLYGARSIRLIEPLTNKGRILLARGDYTEADAVANRVNQIAVKTYGDISTKTANTQKLLTDLYYTLGDYDKAEENVVKAINAQEKQFGRNHVDVARSLSELALIKFYKGGDKKQIEDLMVEARDIIANKLSKDNPQYAEIMKDMAVLYISEKKYDVAFNSLTIAESIWRAKTGSKNNINAASIYTLTGDVYYELRQYDKAEDFYDRAKKLYNSYFSSSHPEYVRVLSKLSKVYYMKKDYKKAKNNIETALSNYETFIKEFFPALSEREKAKYWNTIKQDFEYYNTLAFSNMEDFKDLAGKVYNYQLITKALLLSSSIKIRERILNSTDEQLKAQFNEWQAKKEQLTMAMSMGPAQLEENEIDLPSLNSEVERLEKDLSQKSELFGQNFENKRITYDDVRKSLKPNEVAVEMVRYRQFDHKLTDSVVYAVLYIKESMRRPGVLMLENGTNLEGRYFNFYRNSIETLLPDTESFGAFWGPIQKELGMTSTVYLSPDGVYNQINLEAIPTPDGKYVLDNANIVLVSNTRDLYLRKLRPKQPADNTAALFGNPSFYVSASRRKTIPPLAGTEQEIEQVDFLLKQKGWKTNEYLENTATEEKIKEMVNPKIFHVATHGFYHPPIQSDNLVGSEAELAQNPLMRNGLLLKGAGDLLAETDINFNLDNGILTAYEAMNLNLDRTDLVVLSACETGLGKLEQGEGVYGLQRAFLVAGAKNLIMSMFKVDDTATQKLMLKFYQKWLNTGDVRKSFVDAKKELRTEFPEPYYWAAFMMIGLD